MFLFLFVCLCWIRGNSKLHHGIFLFNGELDYEQVVLEKFAFSNALSLSGGIMFAFSHIFIKLCETHYILMLAFVL